MKKARLILPVVALLAWEASAQRQVSYSGTSITGQLILLRTTNVMQAAQTSLLLRATARPASKSPEFKPPSKLRRPTDIASAKAARAATLAAPATTSILNLRIAPAAVGFLGLTHLDQRNANNGNQFSVEPPSQSVAVGNGFVLEGVNNAFQVYNSAGAPLLPKVLSTNELFGLLPAIDRSTGINGAYPTDMRVFFDQTISRWFVLQRAQDYDIFGGPISSSHLYLAVSQTSDPAGTYNIYAMDTTDNSNPNCPCFFDFPQIGADQYGFYISVNEYNIFAERFVNAAILAISKPALASGSSLPSMYRFNIPFTTGYEFAIQPATTPPGGSYFAANGGLEYFVSSKATSSADSSLAVWAMYNTSSLGTASPNLLLVQATVPTLQYIFPDVATQRPGPLPYGSSLFPPGSLAFIDGGDSRVLSVSYSGGRLYATLCAQVTDDTGRNLVGGAYVVFSPTFRAGSLTAPVLRQGFLAVRQNHLLRPAIAVNPQGKGAIAFTLVGPDHYPTAAFVPFDISSNAPTTLQVVATGVAPEDGFTGYEGGLARWGDYSAAVAAPDGSIWMAMQYIPNAPRTPAANWGTHVSRYVP